MTPEKLVEELDRAVQVPGLANIWVPPIRNRIDMLATGIKSPIGIKVAGAEPGGDRRIAHADRARWRRACPASARHSPSGSPAGATSTSTSTAAAAARYGLNIADVQSVVAAPSAARTSARPSRAARASRSTCAIRASCATRSNGCAAADGHRARRSRSRSARWRDIAHQRRPADAEERECAPLGLGLRRRARPRSRLGRARPAARGRARGDAAARHERGVFGPVRVPASARTHDCASSCRRRC